MPMTEVQILSNGRRDVLDMRSTFSPASAGRMLASTLCLGSLIAVAACSTDNGLEATDVCGGLSKTAAAALHTVAGADRFKDSSASGDARKTANRLIKDFGAAGQASPREMCDIQTAGNSDEEDGPSMTSIPITFTVMKDLPGDHNPAIESGMRHQRYPYGLRAYAGGAEAEIFIQCTRMTTEGSTTQTKIVHAKSYSFGGKVEDGATASRMTVLREISHKVSSMLQCDNDVKIPSSDRPYINKK